MTLTRLCAAAALLCVVSATAHARQAHQVTYDRHGFSGAQVASGPTRGSHVVKARADRIGHRSIHRDRGMAHVSLKDPRPRAWCGWWARQQFGVADRSYNLARKWAGWGTPAHGPAPGVVAVWRHHVGIVTAVKGPGRIVLKSGNDSGAVRERERSTRGIIAYRWPPGARLAMQ